MLHYHLELYFYFKKFPIFQSGSQNDLCDSWVDEADDDSKTRSPISGVHEIGVRGRGPVRNLSAEYPFHRNLCVPHQGINFDLTHKRGMAFIFHFDHMGRWICPWVGH